MEDNKIEDDEIKNSENNEEQLENENKQETENLESEPKEETLEDKLLNAENTSKEYLDRLQRSMAEFDNFRKRTMLEKAAMYERGASDSIEKFLPILDNFERAILSASDEDKETSMYKGIEMIFNQMLETFKSIGVTELAGEGEGFDPNIHNAVLHIDDENFGENVVAEVLQKGYMYKDKVIRPSMVKVAN